MARECVCERCSTARLMDRYMRFRGRMEDADYGLFPEFFRILMDDRDDDGFEGFGVVARDGVVLRDEEHPEALVAWRRANGPSLH